MTAVRNSDMAMSILYPSIQFNEGGVRSQLSKVFCFGLSQSLSQSQSQSQMRECPKFWGGGKPPKIFDTPSFGFGFDFDFDWDFDWDNPICLT